MRTKLNYPLITPLFYFGVQVQKKYSFSTNFKNRKQKTIKKRLFHFFKMFDS
jgi:hypothetical protein